MPSEEYNTILVNLAKPPPALGYYGYLRLRDRIEEMFSQGLISEEEYNYALRYADYQILYFYPRHEDAPYIESLSLWRWSSNCEYEGAQTIPKWLVQYAIQKWAYDTSYPPANFPNYLYEILSESVKEMPPRRCFDFTIRYSMGFDPRKQQSMEETIVSELKNALAPQPEKEEKKEEKNEIQIAPAPTIPPEIKNQIDSLAQEQERTQEYIKSLSQKLNDILAHLKTGSQTTITPKEIGTPSDEESVVEMTLSPSELALLNRNNPANENGKSVWHEIRQIGKLKKKTQVIILRSENETVDEFQNWINGINDRIAQMAGRRITTPRKSIYELRSYLQDSTGWENYTNTVLKNLPQECALYRLGNESKRQQITNLIIYALNLYLEDAESEADEAQLRIDFDYMDASFFPIKEICRIIEDIDRTDRKNKQALKLERIGEMVREWSGTEEGRPALRP